MMKRILYIEDNVRNMRLVRKILDHAGYEVLGTSEGLVGLEIADSERPDLILMDVNLPDIDGLEATVRLKANPELAAIPVVALTANAMHGDRERCLEAGCDGYLAKPVTRRLLLETLEEFFKEV